VAQINTSITDNTLQILEKSIDYKLNFIHEQLNKGRFYLAQMKDSEKMRDNIIEELEQIKEETDTNIRKKHLEEQFDETQNVIRDADLSIKDSKWLRIFTYFGILIAIAATIVAIIK
jgi:hypothetical protein